MPEFSGMAKTGLALREGVLFHRAMLRRAFHDTLGFYRLHYLSSVPQAAFGLLIFLVATGILYVAFGSQAVSGYVQPIGAVVLATIVPFLPVLYANLWMAPVGAARERETEFLTSVPKTPPVQLPSGFPTMFLHDNVKWQECWFERRNQTRYVNADGPLCPNDLVALDHINANGHQGSAAQHAKTFGLRGLIDHVSQHWPLICLQCKERFVLDDDVKQIRESLRQANARIEAERHKLGWS